MRHGRNEKTPVPTMPGQFQLTIDHLQSEIKELQSLQIKNIIVFGLPEYKDPWGSDSYNDRGIVQSAIKEIKEIDPHLLVIADTCFCQYTDHGHCGILNKQNQLNNDETLTYLAKQAVSQAKAGADIIAPSGMIDGMVLAIRKALDENHFYDIPIMSYSSKFASSLYAPFGAATKGAPQFGDRKTHQLNPANHQESILESYVDTWEGADILMVKPALFYLDVIFHIKQLLPMIPLAAYQVSGEYSMIKSAIMNGWLSEKAILESLISIKRAGADTILTYFAKDAAKMLLSQ